MLYTALVFNPDVNLMQPILAPKFSKTFLVLVSFLTTGGVTTSFLDSALAQITPDATLGTESSVVTPNADGVDSISGGATRDTNLFHSFDAFSVRTGGTALFNNAANIQNIISRVTGGSVSNIDGLIGVNGTANLFLLNPNGIIFGPNARLNIGGSFLGSTASSINFADGTQFNATEPQTTPLLIVSVPVGLGFGSSPGRILVQGNGQGARVTTELIDTTSGLRVQPDETLALVGGNVALEGATLKTAGGRIELASVAGSGLVSLASTGKGWELGYTGIPTFGNVRLSQQASVDASGMGGGDVEVRGRRISITDGSQIEASTLGEKPGGTLNINSLDLVELTGESADGRLISGIATQVYPGASGSGGNLNIETGQLIVRDGAQISAGTFGVGNAGSLGVIASNSVEVIGTTVDLLSSGLFSQASPGATGAGGNLNIKTARLTVRDGGLISSGTSGRGAAGSLSISAHNLVEVSGTPTGSRFGSAIATSVEPRATGDGGDLTLETQQLIVRDGATVSSATFGRGRGGTLSVRAKDSVDLIGSSASGIPSGLSARTTGAGNAGSLNIETGQLSVWDGARVTVNSFGEGTAGRLELKAREIRLNNQGKITAETASGQGGEIVLQVQDLLLMRHNSQISTSAGNAQTGGDGGNIDINTKFLVAVPQENSNISANAYKGRGGNIDITAQGIFGIQPRNQDTPLSDITASSELGINGTVQINTPDVDPAIGLANLPEELVEASNQIAQGCPAGVGPRASKFVITGRGGLPPTPRESQDGETVLEDWGTSAQAFAAKPQNEISPRSHLEHRESDPAISTNPASSESAPIVEATGWVTNAKGEVFLIAEAPTTELTVPWLNSTNCHAP